MGELRLDVLAVHLIALYAKIVISATLADSEITDDVASNVALLEATHALEYISATTSPTRSRSATALARTPTPSAPRRSTPTTLARWPRPRRHPGDDATGDCGVVQNLAVANAQCGNTSAGPQTATWDDNPRVTAVGGTVPNVSQTDGDKLGPDPIWHVGGIFAEGAGFSAVFGRPSYQNGVARITGSRMRSAPDITMDAQSGTSESAPW